jgi:glycosyltransferase involved in cell wall biosynthesis/predicted SAM-dependent methyltransferase
MIDKNIVYNKKFANFDKLKLHIGCGTLYKEGWINIDNNSDNNIEKIDLNIDVTNRLPFEDNSIDFIYHEYFIEHLSYEEGELFLQECYRILKPDGVMRFACPDLDKLNGNYIGDNLRTSELVSKYIYNKADMTKQLKTVGFQSIKIKEINDSNYHIFKNIETRKDYMVFEITKFTKKLTNLISVIVTSYNHEKYIKQAIDSILSQKNVNMEILLADDCSKDKTLTIMKKYAKEYPNIIRLLERKNNLGLSKNIQDCIKQSKGDYIAFCEGDDYWIDDYKLYKQVNFLNVNKNVTLCFNQMKIMQNLPGEDIQFLEHDGQKRSIKQNFLYINTRHIILENLIGNLTSCVFRAEVIKGFPEHIYSDIVADWMFGILSSEKGVLYLMPDIMSVYRIHGSNLWSTNNHDNIINNHIKYAKIYNEMLDYKYNTYFKQLITSLLASLNKKNETKRSYLELFFEKIHLKNFVKKELRNTKEEVNIPKVSIIMASYNHEKYVADTIDSVLSQTFVDFEFIITDDGSSDSTPDIIKKYAKKDKRIKVYTFSKNQGACIATENSFKYVKGKYIAIINSDDIWFLNKLEKQVKFLDSNKNIGAVFSFAEFIDNKGVFFDLPDTEGYKKVFHQKNRGRHQWLNHFFYNGNCLCHPSILIRKECYDVCGFYKKELASLPDFDMWIRLCMKYDIHIIQENLIKFRLHDNNESGNRIENNLRHMNELYQVLSNYLDISSTDEFFKIFPNSVKFRDEKLIKFYIAQLTLKHSNVNYQTFGLNTLYNLFENSDMAYFIEKKCNFKYTDLHKLSRETDVFNLKKLHNLSFRFNMLY